MATVAPLVAAFVLVSAVHGQQATTPTFRDVRELISIDVVVRDASGMIVRGLTRDDFEIREDGRPQQLSTLTFQEITGQPAGERPADLLAGVEERVREALTTAGGTTATPAASPPTSLAGRRLIVLLFDLSSMQPEDVQRAVDAAIMFVTQQMSAADLIAMATVSSTLDVLTDFTDDRTTLLTTLNRLGASSGTATPTAEAVTAATEEAANDTTETSDTTTADVTSETDELTLFNNDARLRALRVLAQTLAPIEQKKSVIYFSAGMERSGSDNQVELRAATNAASRANLSIYSVDARGLQAVIPGGGASEPSRGGQGLFSGRNVTQQFDQLAATQDTLVSLSADTGGRAFLNTNKFDDAFARVQRDTSAYYLLGYSSTNPTKDGRFRRVQVRVKRSGLKVEARTGYYADRDFAHTNGADRNAQLQDQLLAAVSSTDLPLLVSSGWFRLTADRYYVPVALAIPGSALPQTGTMPPSVDILGQVRDEQGRVVGRIRDTLRVPAESGAALGSKQLLYQTGVALPPGRFTVKVVARENTNGTVGSFEAPVLVPELKQASLKLSSVVLSSQLQTWTKGRTDNPLVRDGVQLLPNLTRVVGRGQQLFFYYEVYEPGAGEDQRPLLRTSLAFYRGKQKVFETPVVERASLDDAGRKASIFQFELPPDSLAAGVYTCQINVVDAVAGKFAFPRMTLVVR